MPLPVSVGALNPPVFSCHEKSVKEGSDTIEKGTEVLLFTSNVGKEYHQGDSVSLGIKHEVVDIDCDSRRNSFSQGVDLHSNLIPKASVSTEVLDRGLDVEGGTKSPDAKEISSFPIERAMRVFFSESEEDMTEAPAACGPKEPSSHTSPTTSGSLSGSRSGSLKDSSLDDLGLRAKFFFPSSSSHQAERTVAVPIRDSTFQQLNSHTSECNTQIGELTSNCSFKGKRKIQTFVAPQNRTPTKKIPQSGERTPYFAPLSRSSERGEGSHSTIEKVLPVTHQNYHSFQSHRKGGNESLREVDDTAVCFTLIPVQAQEAVNGEGDHCTESCIFTSPTLRTSAADFLSRDRELSEKSNMNDSHIALGASISSAWRKGDAERATQLYSTISDDNTDKISSPNTKEVDQEGMCGGPLQSYWHERKVARAQQPQRSTHNELDKHLELSECSNTILSEDSGKVGSDLPLDSSTALPPSSCGAGVHRSSNLSAAPETGPSPPPPMTSGNPSYVSVERTSGPLHVDPMKGFPVLSHINDRSSEVEQCSASKPSSCYARTNSHSMLCSSNVPAQVMVNDNAVPNEGIELKRFLKRQINDLNDIDISDMDTKLRRRISIQDPLEAGDVLIHSETFRASCSNSSSNSKGTELEAADTEFAWRRDVELDDEITIELEDSLLWSENLNVMTLLDVTPLSSVYRGHVVRETLGTGDTGHPADSSTQTETVLMVLRVYELMSANRQGFTHSFLQQRALQVARKMLKAQRRLEDAGLAGPSVPTRSLNMRSEGYAGKQECHGSVSDEYFDRPVVCRGIIDIHVDSSNRIIAKLDTDPYGISVSDIIAFQDTMLSRDELIALLWSVLTCLSSLHEAGITHGALHGGNITLSTNDGHCTLAQSAGLMNTKIYPDDLSILPPAKAAMLAPLLRRTSIKHEAAVPHPDTPQKPFSSGLVDELELCMLELEENAPWYSPQAADDLYAIGTLTLFAVIGIPVFYGTTYREVVETLAELHRLVVSREICVSEAQANNGGTNRRGSLRQALCARIFHLCFSQSVYVSLRCKLADYTEDFLNKLFEFIVDSMAASFGVLDDEVQYNNAGDLLKHSFFKNHLPEGQERGSEVVGEGETMQAIQDTLHRVTYPIYTNTILNKSLCGTKPYIARMHRHSIFSSRLTALKKSCQCFWGGHFWRTGNGVRSNDDECLAMTTVDGMCALWPTLGRRPAGQWSVVVPWTWSLPSFPGRGLSRTNDPIHYDPHNPHMPQSSLITQQNVSKVNDGLTHEAVGGEFYFSSSSGYLCMRLSQSDNSCIQNPNSRRWVSHSHTISRIFQEEKVKLERQAGCEVLPRFRTVLFASKKNSLLKLHRGQMDYFCDAIDTVVLRDLESCRIELLVPFRFVVLVNMKQCQVYLAPCFMCYIHQVTFCTPVVVACTYLVLRHVADVVLHCTATTLISGDETSGGGNATNSFDSDSILKSVHWEPYSLVYPGLSEDFLLVGLPQECSVHARRTDDRIVSLNVTQVSEHIPPQQRRSTRDFNFISVGSRTDDISYSHALAAYGKRFKHCDDNESDVYFFFNELHRKDVHMMNVHGGPKPKVQSLPDESYANAHANESKTASGNFVEEITLGVKLQHTQISSDPSQLSGYRGMQQCGGRGVHEAGVVETRRLSCASQCPVFFVLDVVDDVVIRKCSHCTVFLVGSVGNMIIENCHHMRIFYVARECVVNSCMNLKLFALVTEYIALERCQDVIVSPLFVECPYFDTILRSIIQETSEESRDYIFEAYEQRDIYTLNKVFQVGGQDVCLSACERVEVQDLAWYEEHPDEHPILLSVSVPVSEVQEADMDVIRTEVGSRAHEVSDGGKDKKKSVSVVGISSCSFFRECCDAAQENMDLIFLRFPFKSMLYECVPPYTIMGEEECKASKFAQVIRIHDLFDPSLLRLPGSLRIRSDYSLQSGGKSAWQQNLPHDQQSYVEGYYSGLSDESRSGVMSACDLILESIAMGKVHLIEVVGNLYIRNCTGPLDILVCAANYIVMEGCVNVTLRAACVAFDAQDSHHCHIALHTNTPPGFLRCSHMLTSALNAVIPSMEELMSCAGVKADVNFFNRPFIHPISMRHVTDGLETNGKGRLELPRSSTVLEKNDCDGSQFDIVREIVCIEKQTRVKSLEQAFLYIRRPIAVVPPLPKLHVNLRERKIHSIVPLDIHLPKEEESSQSLEDTLRMAFAFIAESDLLALHMLEEGGGKHEQEVNMAQQKGILEQKIHISSNTRIMEPESITESTDIKEGEVQEPMQTLPTSSASAPWHDSKDLHLCPTENVRRPLQGGPPLLDESLLKSHVSSQQSPHVEVDVTSIQTPVIVYPLHTPDAGAVDPILQNAINEASLTGRSATGVDIISPMGDRQAVSSDVHANTLYYGSSRALNTRTKESSLQLTAVTTQAVKLGFLHQELGESPMELGKREIGDTLGPKSSEGCTFKRRCPSPQGYDTLGRDFGPMRWELENARRRYWRWREEDLDGAILAARVAAAIQKINDL
ncbi:unnamed protein product [Phytomonas sp. EM1]|nr:unnamed protein product [Phytomonas sp. EM1]|eukprot:CCW60795.1 unnamed protein product [Phytomonas sp. isolate EM1]